MFEAHVLHLLRRYLGEYVRGLSVEALKISVWKGDVVLKDLQLKAEALNALRLPITVKAGFLGSVTLKVPWNRLGKEPVIVLLDRIFILAEPLQDNDYFGKLSKDSWLDSKRRRIEELELALLEAKDKRTTSSETDSGGNTWLGSLVATIVGNLKISITNLHIRYEDSLSNPGHPFCAGLTLAKLAAVTVDEAGIETFVASGALERLRKSLQLHRLAIYHDSNSSPWKFDKCWEDLTPHEWCQMFEAGISEDVPGNLSKWASDRKYLLHPVQGVMKYHRRGKREKRDPDVPFQEASLVLDEVSLTVSEGQYCDGMKLLEGVSTYRSRMQYSHLRPPAPIVENPLAWWRFACQAVLQQQSKMWYQLSWGKILYSCIMRRKYVQLYATYLQQSPRVENEEIKEMDKELDIEVILLWRLLAHAKVESAKSKDAAMERERLRRSSWWSFGWGSVDTSSTKKESKTGGPGHLTKEEWNKINELLSFRPVEDSSTLASPEAPNMLQVSLLITVQRSGAGVLDSKEVEILCGSFENLQVALTLYPKTVLCDLRLQFYDLSAPEGVLIESVSREGRDHALTTTFVHHPFQEQLDWKLSAVMSPCHVTVWRISFDRFLRFLKSSQAISPGVVLETAAALQSKLEEVTRRAQEQLQLVLEERRRFYINLDLDAPKIVIPAGNGGSGTKLLLDLGHFTLQTDLEPEVGADPDILGLYSRFYISGSDISAFVVDGAFDWSELPPLYTPTGSGGDVKHLEAKYESGSSSNLILPVLDRCGMSVVFDQIRVQHCSFPSTRVAIKVPHLGIHFSPGRYHRLLLLLKALEGSDQSIAGAEGPLHNGSISSWHPADFAGEARFLLWGGIGSIVAEWQPCWAVLSGSYLYILETETSQTYQRCSSIIGKQVLEVPQENMGGSENVIVVCHRGVDAQKAIESSHAVFLQLGSKETKAAWLNYLTLATYKTSAPVSVVLPLDLSPEDVNSDETESADLRKQPNLFVMGSLHELQLSICASVPITGLVVGKTEGAEVLILQLQATGGKVEVLQRQCDMVIGMKLHSLKIEDKLQGHVGPSCQYIARSVISPSSGKFHEECFEEGHSVTGLELEDDEEDYDDALPEFGREPPDSAISGAHESSSHGFSRAASGSNVKSLPCWGLDAMSAMKAEALLDRILDEYDETVVSNFVSMRLIFRRPESLDYDGTDTQMNIQMATLDFFCNRPTVIALIDFGTQFNKMLDGDEPAINSEAVSRENSEATERHVVKGLLGLGKSRVVVQLKMHMESARIFLNKEDGSQLAMLAQEKFVMDLRVYPGSFSIYGTLGNLRVCDMLLGPDHQWGWFCDIRDPGCVSLVELVFHSFNKDDDYFQGFDFSLSGKLSAVRIVFLYRFMQEIATYFVALATPHVQQVITVVDKVRGIEKLIQQSDMDGAPALKLDVSLDTPIIIVPRNSDSKEFMQLDLGHLEVFNTFKWHGGGKDDASAVHLDVLFAEITGINMVVGIEGRPGKPMIQEAFGLHIKVQRPLRDLFRKVPEVQVDIQVETLCGVMSDKEYLVIIDCASTNVAEQPHLPQNFRDDLTGSELSNQEFMHLEMAQETDDPMYSPTGDGQSVISWTKTRVNVDIQHAELELYTGLERESRLARLEIQKFWLGYCMTTTSDMDIYITLPKLSVIDLRADTKPEMRLMLGSMSDVDIDTGYKSPEFNPIATNNLGLESFVPQLTMLVMDLRMKPDSQAIVIRVQRPRLLVVLDFLLSVGEFFVPSLGSITGKDEAMDVGNDPATMHDQIRLNSPTYMQVEDMVVLGSDQQLVADAHGIDEFVYDGCGKLLCLNVAEGGSTPSGVDLEPMIVVGCNKRLRFKNIHIKNGFWLNKCVHLSSGSSFCASAEDGVFLEGSVGSWDSKHSQSLSRTGSSSLTTTRRKLHDQKDMTSLRNFVLDMQAVSPELTFYDTTKWPGGSRGLLQRERLLRAKLSFNLTVASKGKDSWMKGHLKALSVEGGSGIVVVDPLDVTANYTCVQEKTTILVDTTDISMRLSFNVLSLFLRFHHDAVSTFQFGSAQPITRCTHFDRIWVDSSEGNIGQQVAIWRPRAPPGYVILSDCATSGTAPPAQAVMAISNTYRHVRKPVQFDLVWSSFGDLDYQKGAAQGQSRDSCDQCCIWMPVAPVGYVSLGCIAEQGTSPPPLSVVYCVRSDLVTSSSISDCIYYMPPGQRDNFKNGCSFWRIENAAGSFLAHKSIESPSKFLICDLREVLRNSLESANSDTEKKNTDQTAPLDTGSMRHLERKPSTSRVDFIPSSPSKAGRSYITTPQLERIWWDKGSESRRSVSIWRPIPPQGYSVVGDCLVEGLEPPGFGVAVRDDDSGHLVRPVRYLQRMHTSGKGIEDVFIWFPVAPAGYVAMGCIATKTQQMPSLDLVRCVSVDYVNQVNFSRRPVWSLASDKNVNLVWNIAVNRGSYNCSLWKVENQANTFIARPDLKRPPAKMAFSLAEIGKRRLRDNLSAEVKIGRLSATLYDDLSGLMTPVADVTVTTINLAAHGRVEALNVVVITSMAASTFNIQLEAWEPLIEPFDGIFKYESYDVSAEASLKVGKRVRITAANVVNVNVSSAAIETLVGAVLAWRKQVEFEQQARMALEMDENEMKNSLTLYSALEGDDLEKVVIQNSLGCDLFLRAFKDNFQRVDTLLPDQKSIVHLPPPKFPEKFMSVADVRHVRQYVVVHVSEAKDLLVDDDGNGQDYLCALRVVASRHLAESQKGLPQSARSRCVRPSTLTCGPESLLATAKWNEVFVFEVSQQGCVNLEIVVTNMAAKGGKGAAVGVVSVPIEEESRRRYSTSSLWNIVKRSLHRSSWPMAEQKSFSLNPPRKRENGSGSERQCCGKITVGMFFFTANPNNYLPEGETSSDFHKDEIKTSDIGLWFATNSDGPWAGLRSVLSLGTIPKQLGDQNVAVEITMQQGCKNVQVRSLIMILNNTDVALDVCICPFSRLGTPDGMRNAADDAETVAEEIFENQRYQPLAGWGSKWPGHLMPTDPGRWSSRELFNSSQEFPDIPLAPGWVWTSDWAVEKSGNVDGDGWYYGPDFQSLKSPPSNTKSRKKSTFDFVRRRCWVRIRQHVPESTYVRSRHIVGVVQAGSSIPMPWSSIDGKTDFCVQVRPSSESPHYSWGRALQDISHSVYGRTGQESSQSGIKNTQALTKNGIPVSAFLLDQLEKTEELLICQPTSGSDAKGIFWLNMEADASILYTHLNAGVYDWRLSVNAPLRIENQLPCKAEYIIWEKPKEGNPVKRQQGVVSAGNSVYIYFVDVRRPIYLTWLAQGGWKPEKEAVLISDSALEVLPSGFWIIHQQTARRLRISLENDFGSTLTSARIVRVFVPYWLCNDAGLPLSYRLVEIEPAGGSAGDTSWLNRAAKAAKQAARRPSRTGETNKSLLHKVVQNLETLEDASGAPIMLSLQPQSDRIGGLSLSSNSEGRSLSPRLGLAITVGINTRCNNALCLRDFEDKMERVSLKAVNQNGSYYKLSAFLDMSSERTKICLEGYKWSQPFSVEAEGMMHITLQGEGKQFSVQTEVLSGVQGSRFLVVFRHLSLHSAYRIENRSDVLPFRYRQAGGTTDSWQLLQPGCAASFAWEDLGREHLLELLVDGADPMTARKYNIDDGAEYQPTPTKGGPVAALRVRIFRDSLVKVVRVADWKPSDGELSIILPGSNVMTPRSPDQVHTSPVSESQFHAILDLAELGISIVDHTPEELLYVTMQNLIISYATGLGSGTSRFKLRVDGLQVDNQLPLTPMPVLFIPQDNGGNRPEFFIKATITIKDNGLPDYYLYPYVGIQGPSIPSVAFLVKIHEPIIWRLHEMFKKWNLNRLTSSQTTDVAMDPIIRIGLLHTTEIRFKVTLAMSPTQRPRGMLGFWSTLMTSLGNTDEMPIRLTPRVHEEASMRQSALIAAAISSIRNDVLSQPFQLLSGVDLLGNASTALGHMSKGVAALSMDKKFIRSRQKQDSKANVEDLGDGLREGGEALAKGLFRGVTGILTKPLEGARSSGVEGFVQGVGKGLIGAAIQPMSGMLDLLSRTTEGANATRMKLTAAITFEEQLLRRRLPRVIGGDNILRPYDEYKARGQVLMQLAERGAIFGPIDLFKVRGKFAMSDAYEGHFNLTKGRTLVITHRRIILLQHPTGLVVQKKPDLLKEPCMVAWDVMWDDLMTMELAHGKDESLQLPPSRLIIHLRNRSQDTRLFDSKESARVVKCQPGSNQASEMCAAIQKAYDTFGPGRSNIPQGGLQRRPSIRMPYSAARGTASSGSTVGLLSDPAGSIAVPVLATFSGLIGATEQGVMEADNDIAPEQFTKRYQENCEQSADSKVTSQIGKLISDFELIWWDKGAPWSKKYQISAWRPKPPSGFVSLGDIVQCSYEPPDNAMVYRDEHDGKFMIPESFDLVWRDTDNGLKEPVTVWQPHPPLGYICLGCIIEPEFHEPSRTVVYCVRQDCVGNAPLGQVPLRRRDYKGAALSHCSLWQVDNEARTFLAQRDHESPPPNLALKVL